MERYIFFLALPQRKDIISAHMLIQGGPGLMYVWASGHLGFWAYGHLGILASGHLGPGLLSVHQSRTTLYFNEEDLKLINHKYDHYFRSKIEVPSNSPSNINKNNITRACKLIEKAISKNPKFKNLADFTIINGINSPHYDNKIIEDQGHVICLVECKGPDINLNAQNMIDKIKQILHEDDYDQIVAGQGQIVLTLRPLDEKPKIESMQKMEDSSHSSQAELPETNTFPIVFKLVSSSIAREALLEMKHVKRNNPVTREILFKYLDTTLDITIWKIFKLFFKSSKLAEVYRGF